jgi:hypothetical protein
MKFKFPTPESPDELLREKIKAKKDLRETGDDDSSDLVIDLNNEIKERYGVFGQDEKEENQEERRVLALAVKEARLEKLKADFMKIQLEKINNEKKELIIRRARLLIDSQGKQGAKEYHKMAHIQARLDQIEEEKQKTLSSKESGKIYRMAELSLYHDDLVEDGHISTSHFEKLNEWLAEQSATSSKILLHGPTGTGKTEMARAFTRAMIGEDPIEVRGHQNTRMEEFSGKTELRASNNTKREDLLNKWYQAKEMAEQEFKKNPDKFKTETERIELEDQMLNLVGQTIGVTTETFHSLGAIEKAKKQAERKKLGVLIIDEYNAIPSDVRGRGLKGYYKELEKAGVLVIATANQKDSRHKQVEDIGTQEIREFSAQRKFLYMPAEDLYDVSIARLMDSNYSIRAGKNEMAEILKSFVDAVETVQRGYTGKLTEHYGQSDAPSKQATLNGLVIEQGMVLSWLKGFNESGLSMHAFLSKKIGDWLSNLHEGTKESLEDKTVIENIFASYGFDTGGNLTDETKDGIEIIAKKYSSKETLTPLSTISELDPYNIRSLEELTPEEKEAKELVSGVIQKARKRVSKNVEKVKESIQPFIKETFEKWGWSDDKKRIAETAPVSFVMPEDLEYSSKAPSSEDAPSKAGEYTLNPEIAGLDFEKITPFVPDLTVFEGRPRHEVFEYVVKTFGKTHYIPDLTYWKWLIENPDKAKKLNPKLADGNYYYCPGSVLRASDGVWSAPAVNWGGSGFDRCRDWLRGGWGSGGRVVLLPR